MLTNPCPFDVSAGRKISATTTSCSTPTPPPRPAARATRQQCAKGGSWRISIVHMGGELLPNKVVLFRELIDGEIYSGGQERRGKGGCPRSDLQSSDQRMKGGIARSSFRRVQTGAEMFMRKCRDTETSTIKAREDRSRDTSRRHHIRRRDNKRGRWAKGAAVVYIVFFLKFYFSSTR